MLARKKERSIEDAMVLVVKWLRLQEGTLVMLPDGTLTRLLLNHDDAALFIGVTKRSIERYILDLRHGE